MASSYSRHYLYCQLIGWGLMQPLLFFITSFLTHGISATAIGISLLTCLSGLFSTHLLRNFIRRYQLAALTPKLLLSTVTAALIGGLFRIAGLTVWATIMTLPKWMVYRNVFAETSMYLLLFIPWTIIYCFYGYIQRHPKEQLERQRRELLRREKELSATGPVVDVDFIIGSLDRIRTLIDDDPGSARAGITAFSHLLRKGQLKTD